MLSANNESNNNNNKTVTMEQFDSIASKAMQSVWNRTPYPFQCKVISHVISMRCKPKRPEVTLLVQRTGSGKSSIYQTIGVIDGGIVLVVENTLSLGADQATKIRQASSQYGTVNAFQLDSIKSTSSRTNLIRYLTSLLPLSHATTFLFSSPEALLQPCWNNLIFRFTFG